MSHFYRFKRGDLVTIFSGRHKGARGAVDRGAVDSAVFQRSVDYPDQFAPGCHVVLGRWLRCGGTRFENMARFSWLPKILCTKKRLTVPPSPVIL